MCYHVGNMRNVLPTFFCILFLAFPFIVSAQVMITEIMYDPKDADAGSGGEWLEVRNTSSVAIDLTQWIFFEAETNHGITAEGATEISPGGYAVIAKDPTAFKNYFSSFSSVLFRASFSLNDGETLAMKSGKDASPSDSVSYTSELGAKNDGNSLQLVGGEWVAAAPTPGKENEALPPPEPPPAVNNQSPPSVGAYVSTPASPLFTARISKKEKFAVVGAGALFKGETIGTANGLSGKTRFLWNFGDGGTGEGESVLHIYKYPGEYVVVLNAVSGTHSPEDRVTIKAIPSELSISNIGTASDFFIELSNNSAYELNLSGWLLKSGARYFVIPERSFILPKKKIIFPQETTNLFYSAGDTIGLLYPNGLSAGVFSSSLKAETAHSVAEKKTESAPTTVKTVVLPARPDKTENPNTSVESTKRETFPVTAALRPVNDENTEQLGIPWSWLFGTLAFVVLGGAGVIISRRGKIPADEFEITEEE